MLEAAQTPESTPETAPDGPSQCPFCRYLVGSKTKATICPECGKPLGPALEELLLEASSFATLRRLRVGLAILLLALGPLYFTVYSVFYSHLTIKVPVAVGIGLMVGWLPLCMASPLRWEFATDARLRKRAMATTILVALMLAALLFAVTNPAQLRRAVYGSRLLFAAGLFAIPPAIMAQLGMSFLYLAAIADRIPDLKVVAAARTAAGGWFVACAATLFGLLVLGIGQLVPGSRTELFRIPIMLALGFIGLPMLVLTLVYYYPMLTWTCGKRIGQVIRNKKLAESGALSIPAEVSVQGDQSAAS